jgi:hypothetical protein
MTLLHSIKNRAIMVRSTIQVVGSGKSAIERPGRDLDRVKVTVVLILCMVIHPKINQQN